ncbi:FecR family protein [Parabacteroides hominis]|mgnify:FL=1|jgi:transmembrane sensor|uniref:FecR family protein n=1 Tax=Parabacteroides hominis TaxID=2763057 RepID=A0ABR7DQ16_9BACT|nr:FecR family protein [Parabacteroides hominis]MBC5632768.1 FecR family protein [Parabacteroides hominis]MBD9166229.1 FecR family protein [Parabacteroides johnsonii]
MDRKVLHRFFAGTASFEEEEAVCDWVDASDKNREELIRERKYFDVLLLHKAKNSSMAQSGRRFSLPFVIGESLKIAAAISVLVVSALYIYNNMAKPAPVLAMNKIVVPPGQRANLTLSDGTNVWLNACSELAYPASFTEESRSVSLKGEAYFDVSKDAEHPFIVQTNQCDIKVLGTKFNVQADESDCEFSAALLEGSIELTNKMNPGPSILLAPMQKAEWTGGKMVVDSIRNLDNYRWKEGLICFEDIRFADLMKRFEKTYDIRIVIRNKSLHDYKCSGKCRVSDGVDFILQVLQRSTRFTFSRNDDNTIIYIK